MSALFKDDEGAKLSAANENIFNGGILWALGIFLFLGLFDTLFGDLYSPTWRSKASDIFRANDPMGDDCGGANRCISNLLKS